MSSKDNTAVSQLFDLLESRYALRVLWALRDGHPQTFRLLQDSVGGVTPNTLNTRLKELRAADLIDHGGNGYGLTKTGLDLLKRLSDLQAFSNKWVAAQARMKAANSTVTSPAVVTMTSNQPDPASTGYMRMSRKTPALTMVAECR